MIDLVVTRRNTDSTQYRKVVSKCSHVTLIEVPFAPSINVARKRLVEFGSSEFVAWLDPDDTLYSHAFPRIVQALLDNPDAVAIMTLSDYASLNSLAKTIRIEDFSNRPVDGHWFTVYRREWLVQHIHLFDTPVAEWAVAATAIEAGAIFLNMSSFCWNVGNGCHRQLSLSDISTSRKVVQSILGDKYTKLVEHYKT